ncbi:MAG: PDZ domain-containing protein [Gemmatimonadetes bacterium]|uniref:Probable periplasmic serine endoprotease DegP-like n=1 Tax=Candidatus Kutchimonas denitrificans TaxID=3056748 RepID=A0AAE4ZAM9_9BACT|nr:PDZ domain-containing protein [Gemmatimonadota bacterium]NIR75637.1 PDZ domain-containing protein [Candidatus Kutchimonas denitrificans]NIS02937.1 PDZ domain-containing protein [Gemmatimonadota bacterium]NIT68659.1 PDZ domain-containing protein [Gemmatimonadota bacterium]NIV25338.1 PDZ domain-containing protein [Gemmatimonadota bacterium]
MGNRAKIISGLAGVLALTLSVAGCDIGNAAGGQEVSAEVSRPSATATTQQEYGATEASLTNADTVAATALSAAFRDAADRVLPAVVFVTVEREAAASSRALPLPEPFRYFFDSPERGQLPPDRGNGSGFIIDPNGRVVTNHHVVAEATNVTVRLHDGREYQAEIVGSDPTTDVAVLQLKGDVENLPSARFRESRSLQVGDWVLALGNPLGLEFTVTAGIVSAKGRQLTGRETALEAYIQTDAAINPGNSGGPLIDLQGRVVGINAAISGGPRFVGYGFAVPSDLAQRVISDLLEYGHVRRPRLGVRISDVTAVDAEAYGLERVAGAEVNSVGEDTPAEEAGLEVGDVIVALDGRPIANATELTTSLAQRQPGDEVELTVVRDGEHRVLIAELGEFPSEGEPETRVAAATSSEELLGFTVQPVTPRIADRFGYDIDSGLVISQVERYGPAARAGIRPGQLLLRIDGQPVRDESDFASLAGSIASGDVVSVRVRDPQIGETIINYRTR